MIELALDAILILVLVEALALPAWRARTGRGVPTRALLPNLAAGFFLMLAVRIALAPQLGPWPIAACLTCALVAHLVDLAMRWRP